jgi:hypothetical protein
MPRAITSILRVGKDLAEPGGLVIDLLRPDIAREFTARPERLRDFVLASERQQTIVLASLTPKS